MIENAQLIITTPKVHGRWKKREPRTGSLKSLAMGRDSRYAFGLKRYVYGHLREKGDQEIIESFWDPPLRAQRRKIHFDDFIWNDTATGRAGVRYDSFEWLKENVSGIGQVIDDDLKGIQTFSPSNKGSCNKETILMLNPSEINYYLNSLSKKVRKEGRLVIGPNESPEWLRKGGYRSENKQWSYTASLRGGVFVFNMILYHLMQEPNPFLLPHLLNMNRFEDGVASFIWNQKNQSIRHNWYAAQCHRDSHSRANRDKDYELDLINFIDLVGAAYAQLFYPDALGGRGKTGTHEHLLIGVNDGGKALRYLDSKEGYHLSSDQSLEDGRRPRLTDKEEVAGT